MRSAKPFLPKNRKLPIPDNCPDLATLSPPVQELADLLAEIAARRLNNKYPTALNEQEKLYE